MRIAVGHGREGVVGDVTDWRGPWTVNRPSVLLGVQLRMLPPAARKTVDGSRQSVTVGERGGGRDRLAWTLDREPAWRFARRPAPGAANRLSKNGSRVTPVGHGRGVAVDVGPCDVRSFA
jgi:hypothetical protein